MFFLRDTSTLGLVIKHCRNLTSIDSNAPGYLWWNAERMQKWLRVVITNNTTTLRRVRCAPRLTKSLLPTLLQCRSLQYFGLGELESPEDVGRVIAGFPKLTSLSVSTNSPYSKGVDDTDLFRLLSAGLSFGLCFSYLLLNICRRLAAD